MEFEAGLAYNCSINVRKNIVKIRAQEEIKLWP